MGLGLPSFLDGTLFWALAAGFAAFLTLTWVLRGAPLGQSVEAEEDQDAPASSYRDRIVIAVVIGLLMIISGGMLAFRRGVIWSLPVFLSGFGLVIALLAFNRRYRHSSPSLRRTIDFAGGFLNAALVGGLLFLVNVLVVRYGTGPLDLTREGTYSLSPLSLNQIRGLDRKVTLTLIFGQGPRAARQVDRVVQLAESYQAANPAMVDVQRLDPYLDLSRVDELVERAPELKLLRGGGVLVEYGEGENARHVVVRNQDLFLPGSENGGLDRFESAFLGEDEITSALIRLREGTVAKVAFTIGHGEPSLSDLNPGGRGMGTWKTRLGKVGCEVVEVNLIQDNLPKELSLLVIAGPRSRFRPEELAKIKAYTTQGGPVLAVLTDPASAGLDELLRSWNLVLGPGLLVEPRLHYNRNPYLAFVPLSVSNPHPISSPMGENRAVFLPNASPIRILGLSPPTKEGKTREPVNPLLVPMPFLRSSPQSWVESDAPRGRIQYDQGIDERGPLNVAVAIVERKSTERPATTDPDARPRFVVISSAGMAENLAFEIEQANLDLLMNAASWLQGRKNTIGISPRTHVALTLTADPVLRSRLVTVPTCTAVLVILGLGVTVYFARRS